MTEIKDGWRGRFLEDFETGDIYRCRFGRTITESDNINFSLLTCNSNQIHFNRDYGRKSGFGDCLVNSALTLAIVVGMSVEDVSENGYALGFSDVRLPNPLFPGDTLYSETEVVEVRASESRPGQGVVTVKTRGYNQKGVIVIELQRAIMVWKREFAPANDIFPAAPDS